MKCSRNSELTMKEKTKMQCEEVRQKAEEFLEETLSASEEALIDSHLRECKECEEAFEDVIESGLHLQLSEEDEALGRRIAQFYAIEEAGEEEAFKKIDERIMQEAVKISEETAKGFNVAGAFYRAQGEYDKAKSCYRRVLSIWEESLPDNHPYIAAALNHLALVYYEQDRHLEAEPLYRLALSILEKGLPADHLKIATTLNNLALVCHRRGKSDEAEPLYRRALSIREKLRPADHSDIAQSLNGLGMLCRAQDKYDEAEPLYLRALSIWEKVLPAEHRDIAAALNNLALVYCEQGKYDEAEPLFIRAVRIVDTTLGSDHSLTRIYKRNYENMLTGGYQRLKLMIE